MGPTLARRVPPDPTTGRSLLSRRKFFSHVVPHHVIGIDSPIELCPYVLDIVVPGLYTAGDRTPVRPAAHHDALSRTLLAELSGTGSSDARPSWALIGAGSLGSKLALHLARAGDGARASHRQVSNDPTQRRPPRDQSRRRATCHALWTNAKAIVLCDSLRGLNHNATPRVVDARAMLASGNRGRQPFPKQSWALVNATASLAVREAFASTERVTARVIETSLFGRGKVGVIRRSKVRIVIPIPMIWPRNVTHSWHRTPPCRNSFSVRMMECVRKPWGKGVVH